MARLYADENFPRQTSVALRALGHDVQTTAEAGMASRKIDDPEVLAFAVAQGRAVLTINRLHFIRLHRSMPDHAGIVVCTQDLDMGGQAERIHAAITATGTLTGQLIRVNRPAR